MEIKEIKDKNIWEDFLFSVQEKTFLQSWNWGEFQEKMGNKVWRFGIFNNSGKLLSVALVVKLIAKRGTFLMVQHGPTIAQSAKCKAKSAKQQCKTQNSNFQFSIFNFQ